MPLKFFASSRGNPTACPLCAFWGRTFLWPPAVICAFWGRTFLWPPAVKNGSLYQQNIFPTYIFSKRVKITIKKHPINIIIKI